MSFGGKYIHVQFQYIIIHVRKFLSSQCSISRLNIAFCVACCLRYLSATRFSRFGLSGGSETPSAIPRGCEDV